MSKKKSKATKQATVSRSAERAAAIRKEHESAERRRRNLVVTAVVVVILAIVFATWFGLQQVRDTTGQVANPPNGVSDTYAVPLGKESAPVTVTVYEDFMCPFCGQFEAASRPVLKKYVDNGEVKIEYRVVSFLDRGSNGTKYSTRAMNALGVVLDTSGQQVAKKFHDLMYENQPQEGTSGLADDEIIDLAVKAGAEKSEVSGPIRGVRFEQWVQNATDAASKAKITSTPTVMVDGKPVTGATIDEIVAAMSKQIDAKLAK